MAREILVTGSDGFVGRRLIPALEKMGHAVRAFSRKQGDIASAELGYSGVDHVIHLAARTFVPESWRSPKPFFETNVLGTLNVLEFCKRQDASLTLVSSYVYGRPERLPIAETHPVEAFNPYNQSKIMAEQLARFYEAHAGLTLTIVRPFNLYGSGQDGRFLIPTLVHQFLDNSCDRVEVADLRPKRDYLHVDDLVRMLATLADRPQGGIYNAGSGTSISVADLAEAIRETSGSEKSFVSRGEERENEVMDVRADITKAEQELGWRPAITLRQGLAETIDGYRNSRLEK